MLLFFLLLIAGEGGSSSASGVASDVSPTRHALFRGRAARGRGTA